MGFNFQAAEILPFNCKSLLVSRHHYQSGLLWVVVYCHPSVKDTKLHQQ